MREYNVLWLEDEPERCPTFKKECKLKYGIILHESTTVEDGIMELRNHGKSWDAVLLDAKMPVRSNTVANVEGLSKIKDVIKVESLNRSIPYFISTGQPDLCSNSLFEQMAGTRVYRKGADDVQLMNDIVSAIENSNKIHVMNDYHAFFDASDNLDMEQEAKEIILSLLLHLHYPSEYKDFEPKLYYNQLRHVIEHVFRALGKFGILPEVCINDGKGKVNLTQCSLYLAGKSCEVLKIKYGFKEDDRIIPPFIENIIRSVLEFGNIHSHTIELSNADETSIEKILCTANSKYLIFGLTLQLMEVVIWFDELILDLKANRKVLLPCNKVKEDNDRDKYVGKNFIPEYDEKNKMWHCGECFILIKGEVPSTIEITNIGNNTNPNSNRFYKYYANYK